jgi:hypothetical protein
VGLGLVPWSAASVLVELQSVEFLGLAAVIVYMHGPSGYLARQPIQQGGQSCGGNRTVLHLNGPTIPCTPCMPNTGPANDSTAQSTFDMDTHVLALLVRLETCSMVCQPHTRPALGCSPPGQQLEHLCQSVCGRPRLGSNLGTCASTSVDGLVQCQPQYLSQRLDLPHGTVAVQPSAPSDTVPLEAPHPPRSPQADLNCHAMLASSSLGRQVRIPWPGPRLGARRSVLVIHASGLRIWH